MALLHCHVGHPSGCYSCCYLRWTDKLAAEYVDNAGLVDKIKVAVMGGSHGGFLTGNLVGQYPAAFKCGVLRNPVMDLGLMIHCSDIPDWTYIEAFGCKVKLPHEQH